MMTINKSHRMRLARALAAMTDLSYQAALQSVTAAAQAGNLPAVLDTAGMREALDQLLTHAGNATPTASSLAPRYHRLAEIVARPERSVPARVAAAAAAGPLPIRVMGQREAPDGWDEDDSEDGWDEDDSEDGQDWLQRVIAAGARSDAEFADVYPGHRESVPVDIALDRRDHTGDIDEYERTLVAISRSEPRDVDAWAHLGHLYFAMAGGDDYIIMQPSPNAAESRRYLRTALGYYQAAVAVGELSMPDPYTGFLAWGWIYNRPFFRGLHGMALTLWRLQKLNAAEATLRNMLWLNPDDNQGARFLLESVRTGTHWQDTETN